MTATVDCLPRCRGRASVRGPLAQRDHWVAGQQARLVRHRRGILLLEEGLDRRVRAGVRELDGLAHLALDVGLDLSHTRLVEYPGVHQLASEGRDRVLL